MWNNVQETRDRGAATYNVYHWRIIDEHFEHAQAPEHFMES